MACALLYDLTVNGQPDEVRALFPYLHEIHSVLVDELALWARMADLSSLPDVAELYLATARVVMPDHAGARACAAKRK